MVSVIIPTYGKPVYLDKAIESVLNQTYSDLELIIVDDNNPNTDERAETERIVGKYEDKRIKYIQHLCNRNGATARNTALAVATGEYISFLDSDDEYFPTRLEQCKNALDNRNEEFGGVFTGCDFRRKGKTYLKYTAVESGNYLVDTLACRFMFCTGSNLFLRRSVFNILKGFDESFIRHQDYEFLVRFFLKYSLAAIPEMLVIKNNENFNVPVVEKMIDIKRQYLDKYSEIIKTLTVNEINYIYHSNNIALGETAIKNRKYGLAKEYYQKAEEYGRISVKDKLRRIALTIQTKIS